MTTQTTQQLIEQLIEQGRTQAIAQATIALYEARFGSMPPVLRSAVEAMRDLPTLQRWNLLAGTGKREEVDDALSAGAARRSS
ncbi:hypothetical protein WME89_16125 [Sorangium sp. So ce321]|uniref:hypothetical protein n=1 Tax=Sorangium sp. So ce321 TaxID=3133300 RepID=UPI003F60D5D5